MSPAPPRTGPFAAFALAWKSKSRLFLVGSGKVAGAGFGLVANVFIANALGPADYGLFGLSIAIAMILFELSGYGVETAMVKVASSESPDQAAAAVRRAFLFKLVFGLILLAGGALASGWLARDVFGRPELRTPILFALAGAWGMSLWRFTLAALQARERFAAYAVVQTSNNFFKVLALSAVFFMSGLGLVGALSIQVATLFVGFAVGLWLMPRDFMNAPPLGASEARQMRALASWMIFSTLLFVLFYRLDVLMITWLMEDYDRWGGIYTAAFNLILPLEFAIASVTTVLLPRVSRLSRRGEFGTYARQSLALTLTLTALASSLFFLAGPFVRLLYRPEYEPAAGIILLLLPGFLLTLNTDALILLLFVRRRAHWLAVMEASKLALAFALHLWAIPRYGVLGAAAVTMGARIFGAALGLGFLALEWKRLPDRAEERDSAPEK